MSRRVSSPVFVGRESELNALLNALDGAAGGHGGLVLVDGEAGIGKSRLIEEFLIKAKERGATPLIGSCLPFAEAVPYAPVARILDHAAPAVADPVDRFQFFQRVVDQLTATAADRPVVVVVEDLHWADESTGDLLLFVANAVRAEPIVLIGSRRPGEHDQANGLAAAFGELIRSGRAERILLDPLLEQDVALLIGGILGVEPSGGLLRRVVARADGNPFFAEELVAAGGGDDLPTTVGDVILQRVARVGFDTRRLLSAAAVVGRQVSHPLLREVADIEPAAMDDALRDAVRHQLLVTSRDHYSFRHALGHEAVYRDLLPNERHALHERVAVALTEHPELAAGGEPAVAAAELAHHWHAAGRAAEALAASVHAGQAADVALAPIEADIHYQRAIAAWEQVPEAENHAAIDLASLLERAAEAASLAGNHRRAAELADRLLGELDPDDEPERHARALDRRALYVWYQGDVAASKLATDDLKDEAAAAPTPATVTRLCGVAHQLALQLQYVQALDVARDALAAARQIGSRVEISFALHVLGSLEGHLGRHEDAIDHLRASLTMSVERGDSQRIGATWHNLVEAHIFADRAGDARTLTGRALPELRHLGLARTYVALTTGQLTYALIAFGLWDDAGSTSTTALAEDVELYFTLPIQFGRLHLLVRRGRFDEANALLDDLAGTFDGNAYTIGVCAGWRAEMAVWRRDWDAARSALDAGSTVTASTDEILLELRLAALGARLAADELGWQRLNASTTDVEGTRAAADGHVQRAGAFLARIEDAVGCCSLPFRRLLALVRAERSRLEDPPPAAPWRDITASAGDDAYLAAYGLWREAETLLAGTGRRNRARAEAALVSAHAAVATLGAAPLQAEIADLARRARIELEPTTLDTAGELAAFGLTPREIDVLRLLASGLSNREIGEALFISAKTASVHVTHIFQKLNVTTRVQAAIFAQRLAG